MLLVMNMQCRPYSVQIVKSQAALCNSLEVEAEATGKALWRCAMHGALSQQQRMMQGAETLGPRSEVAHWRRRVDALMSILDSTKRPENVAVAGIASVVRSKEHKQWKAVEAKVS